MQALSFAVHIPIVCFGVAFSAFVLLLEGLWLRTGDPLYRTIAKRWSTSTGLRREAVTSAAATSPVPQSASSALRNRRSRRGGGHRFPS